MDGFSVKLAGKPVDLTPVKGMTLPAKSLVDNVAIASQLKRAGIEWVPGREEALLLSMDGPFEQNTGGKGANAAAAAGHTFACELICNFGNATRAANEMLFADLKQYGKVDTGRSGVIDGPTGTAYILLFGDNDNAILLLGGANQSWPSTSVVDKGSRMYSAIEQSVAVMLQREIPDHINVQVARTAHALQKPVFMDVGGTDAPLDEALMPYISVIAPNESELTFISGVETTVNGKIKKSLVRAAVQALKAKFIAVGNAKVEVLVTLGGKGSMHFDVHWVNRGIEDDTGLLPHECHMGAYGLATADGKPRDTTGAGDCFRGSYVATRYGESKTVAEAMRWAAAAGSLSVEIEGAMPSMPPRSAIEARLAAAMTQTELEG
jgi:ribokinase